MNEIYTLTIFLDRKYMSTATVFKKSIIFDLLALTDNNMRKLGYKGVYIKKVRTNKPDRKKITNYSLCYTKI